MYRVALLTEKRRFGSEALVLTSGLLVMGVEDENFHRDIRKEFALVGRASGFIRMG